MNYAQPDVLVDTEWVSQQLKNPKVKVLEVDVDTSVYQQGHIPGAGGWNWTTQTQDQTRRDILNKAQFESLMSEPGIATDSTVVLYGDSNNWFAAYAFWLLKLYGHDDVRILNGGRKKWLDEKRVIATDTQNLTHTVYKAKDPDLSLRAQWKDIHQGLGKSGRALVDVRSPAEFKGEILAAPGLTETAQRAGHIPGAISIPWALAVKEDSTFKSVEDLQQIYVSKGVSRDKEVTAYCRIGERSSHTWFVLKYLLGYRNVRNYDGSWTEWGNMVNVPIEK